MRAFVGERALPLQVFFTHPKPRHHAEYTRVFGGAERFSQSFTGIELPLSFLDQRSAIRWFVRATSISCTIKLTVTPPLDRPGAAQLSTRSQGAQSLPHCALS
jgi:hypothetical protein